MALPKAVAKQNELADQLINQINEAKQGKAERGTPRPPDPAAAQETVQEQRETEAPAVQTGDDPGTWEQRYRTLQGMMRSATDENRELKSKLSEADREIQSLRGEVQSLAGASTSAEGKTITETDLKSLLEEEDLDLVGEDIAGILVKLVNKATGAQTARIEKKIDQTREGLEERLDREFRSKLKDRVPDFDVLNTSQSFIKWTQQIDGDTGFQRSAFMQRAWDERDVDTLARYCAAFKEQEGAGAGASLTPYGGGGPGPSSENSSEGKRIFSSAEVRQFYRELQAGRIKPEDAQRLEAEITVAAAEGRVR